jgi:hypothetical protein
LIIDLWPDKYAGNDGDGDPVAMMSDMRGA